MIVGWPEITWFGISGINIIAHTIFHGREKTYQYDIREYLLCLCLSVLVLYYGGFFD